MKAIILGAGRIGRGFVSQILIQNNIDVVFFDQNPELVASLNKHKSYTIHVMGYSQENTVVDNVRAYSINDIDSLAREWLDAQFIMTAVGGKNLISVGKYISAAFKKICSSPQLLTSNIITCENWTSPAQDLQQSINAELTDNEKQLFLSHVGISEAVILTTGAGSPDQQQPKNPCDTWVQNFKYLPIDKARILGPVKPLNYVEWVEKFGDLLKQKLYTNNTSVGLIAYLGYLKGFKYVADAANDPEIELILDQAYNEINTAIIDGMHIDAQSQYAFSKRAKNKYQDRNIVDLITRIARDPIRKLSPEDRLVGPAKILLRIGKQPKAICMAIAAALYYQDPNDESAVKLYEKREELGAIQTLITIAKLSEDDPLLALVQQAIDELKQKGWIKGDI